MARPIGILCRFVCCQCGQTEMATGGSDRFRCSQCRPPYTPQYLAHRAVATAIRKGELVHPSAFPCADCGGSAAEYDHRDYSRPLDVEPVCRGCNARRGPAINHPVRGRHPKRAGLEAA